MPEAKVEFDEESGQLVSAEAICADEGGKIVPCDSPEATVQVAGAGAPIPPKTAKKYGLSGKGKEGGEGPEPVVHQRTRPVDISGKAPK